MKAKNKKRGCTCCDADTTKAQMARRHGTPEEFARSVLGATPEVTPEEAADVISRYEDEWAQALDDA